MDETAKLQHVQINVSVRVRLEGQMPEFQPPFEAYLRNNLVYRLSFTGMWGDQSLYISDGTTFLHDPLDDSQVVDLKDGGKPIYEEDSELGPRGSYASPLWYFLSGSASFDKMVDAKLPIVAFPVDAPYAAIRFSSKGFGTVTALYLPRRSPELVGFRYDDLPHLRDMHKADPDDFPDPRGVSEYSQMLSISRLRETKAMFDVVPPVGRTVNDVRKKKGLG